VIGHYEMGFEIRPANSGSTLTVFINYDLPPSPTHWLGFLLGNAYAKWCVGQMLTATRKQFARVDLH
jgi:hypothetical protein